MNTLALDLGTKTGYAYNVGNAFLSGTWSFGVPAEIKYWGQTRLTRRCDPRILRFFNELRSLPVIPDLVIFEDVQFQTYTLQCQLWSSYRTAVWLSFSTLTKTPPTFECVDVSTLKKFATGHGGATKEMMLSALNRKWPGFLPNKKSCDDNEVDAIWLWLWAKQNIKTLPAL